MYRLIYLLMIISVSSCGSSRATLIPQRGFKIGPSTVVCISQHYLASSLEAAMLQMGVQVVPYEFALTKTIQTEQSQSTGLSSTKRTESYTGIEVPAAILIQIDGYDSMQFRFIDMKTQRLLAVYQYRVDPNYESVFTKSAITRFKKLIQPYIVH